MNLRTSLLQVEIKYDNKKHETRNEANRQKIQSETQRFSFVIRKVLYDYG